MWGINFGFYSWTVSNCINCYIAATTFIDFSIGNDANGQIGRLFRFARLLQRRPCLHICRLRRRWRFITRFLLLWHCCLCDTTWLVPRADGALMFRFFFHPVYPFGLSIVVCVRNCREKRSTACAPFCTSAFVWGGAYSTLDFAIWWDVLCFRPPRSGWASVDDTAPSHRSFINLTSFLQTFVFCL
jgi:hypothetical protein